MAHGGAGAQELRTVLATGDDVPGLGRIGRWGVHFVVLGDDGRALVSRVDGDREESVWADGDRFSPLIDPSTDTGIELVGYELVGNRSGAAAGFGFRRSDGVQWASVLYSVIGGRLTEIARVGGRDRDGYTFCELHTPAVNAGGALAFSAYVVPDGYACPDLDADGNGTPVFEGLYLADGELRRIGGTDALAPPGWDERSFNLLALSDTGEAIIHVGGGDGQRLLAVGTGGVRVLYRVGEADGPGVIGRGGEYGFDILAANATGMVLFRRSVGERTGLYRAAGGQVDPILIEGEPAPWGGTYGAVHAYGSPDLNDRGDVLLVLYDGAPTVLYPTAGPPRVFPGRTAGGALNNRLDVALLVQTSDESFEVVRYRGTEVRRLAGTGDRLPSGGTFAARGLSGACLAPNGAIAVTAQTTNGDTALVCGDSNGFAPVSRMGDGRPDGRRFYTFESCAFAGPQELFFIGTSLAPSGAPREYFSQRAVYRAGPDRLERVLGPGDVLSDGSRITWLPSWWSAAILDADPSGRLLALAKTDDYGRAALVIAHADGRRERLALRLRNNAQPNERIRFAPDSSIDHEYLSGVSSTPTAAAAAPPRAGLHANATDPYYDIGAVGVSYASLAASGGVFVMGNEAVADEADGVRNQAVLLYVADGVVRHIDASGESVPAGSFYGFEMLRVAGDRAVFQARSTTQGSTIFSYALGDPAPTEVVRAGDSSPAGTLRWPSPLAVTPGGVVYFLDNPAGAAQPIVFVWENGVIRVIGPIDPANVWWADSSDAGALLVPTDSRLRLAGPGASAATCPHPETIVPPTLVPVPPPPGATPPPDELPFEPAPCIPGSVCMFVGSATTNPGAHTQVEVYLRTNFEAVAATQNDLHLPPLARVTRCVRNDAIDKESTAFSITDERTRAIVISLVNLDAIADGALLYSCEIAVDADAPPGHYPLSCDNPGSSDATGIALPTSCAEGVLTVAATDSGAAAQSSASGSSGGCAIEPGVGEPAWLALLGALIAVGAARRRGSL